MPILEPVPVVRTLPADQITAGFLNPGWQRFVLRLPLAHPPGDSPEAYRLCGEGVAAGPDIGEQEWGKCDKLASKVRSLKGSW